jgi:uncharacterized protein with FMN-binding domain
VQKRAVPAAAVASAALILPYGTAVAATVPKLKAKKKVVTLTKTVPGGQATAGRWGALQVTLVVKKTTTIVGTKKTVARKITDAKVPVYPDHTDRSVYINQQALPLLVKEVLQAGIGMKNLQLISGATDTSYAFADSLQAALVAAAKV